MWKINGNSPGRVICVTCVFLAPCGWMVVWLIQLNISSEHAMLQLILGMKAVFSLSTTTNLLNGSASVCHTSCTDCMCLAATFFLTFASHSQGWRCLCLTPQVPLQLIECAECRDMFQLHVTCKDCKVIRYDQRYIPVIPAVTLFKLKA